MSLKRRLKHAFSGSGMHAVIRRTFPSRLPVILRYHSVGGGMGLVSEGISVSRKSFEEHVAYFARHFENMSLDALVAGLRNPGRIPRNAVLFTFDDGYADNFYAATVLHRYGMTGVFYITAGCIESEERFWVAEVRHLIEHTSRPALVLREGNISIDWSLADRESAIRRVTKLIKSVSRETRESIRTSLWKQCDDVGPFPSDLMLSWAQLQEMAAMGMEIGGHTLTHPNLPNATPEEAWVEIAQCKTLLEERLKTKVQHFAYPNGGAVAHYNAPVKALVKQAGFASATTSKSGLVGQNADVYELRRMRATESLSEMLWEIEELRVLRSTKDAS